MSFELISQIFDIVSSIVGTAAMIAAITPTPKDDMILGTVRKAIDFVGFNFMFAKNK